MCVYKMQSVALLFGTGPFRCACSSLSAIQEREKMEEGVKSCKNERLENISYNERTAIFNRCGLIIVLNIYKQQKCDNGSDNR